jgi:hypothetical protein
MEIWFILAYDDTAEVISSYFTVYWLLSLYLFRTHILNAFVPNIFLQSKQDCRMQERMATEVKQSNTEPMKEKLTEKEERELALLVELAKIYYDGP